MTQPMNNAASHITIGAAIPRTCVTVRLLPGRRASRRRKLLTATIAAKTPRGSSVSASDAMTFAASGQSRKRERRGSLVKKRSCPWC